MIAGFPTYSDRSLGIHFPSDLRNIQSKYILVEWIKMDVAQIFTKSLKVLKSGVRLDFTDWKQLKFLSPQDVSDFSILFTLFLAHNNLPEQIPKGRVSYLHRNNLGVSCDSADLSEIVISSNFLKFRRSKAGSNLTTQFFFRDLKK